MQRLRRHRKILGWLMTVVLAFWLPQSQTFALALDTAGKHVNHPSVLTAVPMWFCLLDPKKSLTDLARILSKAATPPTQTSF